MRRFGTGTGRSQPVLSGRYAAWCGTLLAALAILVLAPPKAKDAERLAVRLAAAVKSLPRRAPIVPLALLHGQYSNGTPAVGALFTTSGRALGTHFCTGSVVASPVRDLVITAAHCLDGYRPGQVEFVPGYHRGQEPFGRWKVSQVFVDGAWSASGSPDDDVAILVVHQPGSSEPVQDLTGGEKLATGWKAAQLVKVIGYPDGRQRPISCTARTRAFGSRQMEFDCGGYTNGTSGGPFLAKVRPATGLGTVLGVIGGYEEGGDTPSVSYSARFGQQVRTLYDEAVAGN